MENKIQSIINAIDKLQRGEQGKLSLKDYKNDILPGIKQQLQEIINTGITKSKFAVADWK